MSWTIAGDWLTVGGLAFLAVGTGLQSWDMLIGFISKSEADPPTGMPQEGKTASQIVGGPFASPFPRRLFWFIRKWIHAIYVGFRPRKLKAICGSGVQQADEIAHFLRLTAVWSTIMLGSVLVLVAAVIQLAFA